MAALFPSCYEIKSATEYLRILSKARPIEEVLADPATDARTRAFLERCTEIRVFAIEDLGMRGGGSYESYADPGRDHIADVVQACAALSFERYLWNYAFVGKLPYKGFFERAQAEAEAARLRARGLDVIVRPVDAFSTLGFLEDPLWSFMASYGEADLAELIIHELTHATAFRRGREDFNEELASFTGERGARAFIEAKYGADSPQARALAADRASAQAFRDFLAETASRLEALYGSGAGETELRTGKAAIIAERAAEWRAWVAVADPEGPYARFDMGSVNNAYLDLFRLYHGEEELYARGCDQVFDGDLRAFIAAAARIAKSEKDPKGALRRLLD